MTQRTINLYDGLEALYYFDSDYFDTQTNKLKDKSGHGRHAEASGGPTVGVEGPNDFEAASFDGSDDDFNYQQKSEQEQTISVLVKSNGYPNKRHTIVEYDSVPNGYHILYSFGDIEFRFPDSSGNLTIETSNTPTDVWKLYTGLWDGGTVQLFEDNTLVASAPSTSHNTSSRVRANIGSSGGSNYWNGDIAFAGRWSRALSDTEIEYLNSLTAPRRQML